MGDPPFIKTEPKRPIQHRFCSILNDEKLYLIHNQLLFDQHNHCFQLQVEQNLQRLVVVDHPYWYSSSKSLLLLHYPHLNKRYFLLDQRPGIISFYFFDALIILMPEKHTLKQTALKRDKITLKSQIP